MKKCLEYVKFRWKVIKSAYVVFKKAYSLGRLNIDYKLVCDESNNSIESYSSSDQNINWHVLFEKQWEDQTHTT